MLLRSCSTWIRIWVWLVWERATKKKFSYELIIFVTSRLCCIPLWFKSKLLFYTNSEDHTEFHHRRACFLHFWFLILHSNRQRAVLRGRGAVLLWSCWRLSEAERRSCGARQRNWVNLQRYRSHLVAGKQFKTRRDSRAICNSQGCGNNDILGPLGFFGLIWFHHVVPHLLRNVGKDRK